MNCNSKSLTKGIICTFLSSFMVLCLAGAMNLGPNVVKALVVMSGLFSKVDSVFFKAVVSGAGDGLKGTEP